jgi:hypothetical protein
MLLLATLKYMEQALKADADYTAGLAAALDAEIQKIKSDASRSPQWVADQIESARDAAIKLILSRIKSVRERVASMIEQRNYYKSTTFLLSRQVFNDSETNDSIIKAHHLRECEAMPAALLLLTAESAKEDKNLALLWQCWLAGNLRGPADGWKGVSLEGVTVPQQDEALQLIAMGEVHARAVEMAFTVASGGVLTGVDKLQFGHLIEAARPGGPKTRHNSEGRV